MNSYIVLICQCALLWVQSLCKPNLRKNSLTCVIIALCTCCTLLKSAHVHLAPGNYIKLTKLFIRTAKK